MRNTRFIVGLALGLAVVLGGYLLLRSYELLALPALANVKDVPRGHQEVAWIAPATSDETWERIVAAAGYLVKEWPQMFPRRPALQADFSRAFLDLTADVPQIGLFFQGRENSVLWIRWYKVSSEIDAGHWLSKLVVRHPAPLAILGGETSDRAVSLASSLSAAKDAWQGSPPLFLITTATANHYQQEGARDKLLKLMEIYAGRTFRFSFNNASIAKALMEFVREHSETWLPVRRDASLFAGLVADGTPWGILERWIGGEQARHKVLYTFAWADDRYSLDLANELCKVFPHVFSEGARDQTIGVTYDEIPYGVGDYYLPNPRETQAAGRFLASSNLFRRQHVILALPASSQNVRRFLRVLCGMGPMELRNLVVVSGDSITFNHIYRDRDLAWNILDMPVPLVFFSHRNPVDAEAGFGKSVEGEDRIAVTGTQDLLLFVDILSALAQAAFPEEGLVGGADALLARMREMRWKRGRVYQSRGAGGGVLLFDERGDRRERTGEHVVWLRPRFLGDIVTITADITVWCIRPEAGTGPNWRQAGRTLEVQYNSVTPPNHAHGSD
jgi:hypothetical protein